MKTYQANTKGMSKMNIGGDKKKRDAADMPIGKPSDPLPAVFETVPHSGFTTRRRRDKTKVAEPPRSPRSREVKLRHSN